MIKGIQLLGIIICLYLIYQTYYRSKKGALGNRSLIFWTALWVSILFLFFFPSLTLFLAPILNASDSMQMVQVIGIMILYILIFHLTLQMASLEEKLTKLTQNMSIRDYLSDVGEKEK